MPVRTDRSFSAGQDNNITAALASTARTTKAFDLSVQHLVRVGIFGNIGRFASPDAASYPRGTRVICRTARGLETGEVLTQAESTVGEIDGSLIRRVSVEDDLLLARLEKNREAAFAACQDLLVERQVSALLMDVELLFDGATLFFYFLGEVTPEIEELTSELADTYEAKVEMRRFAEMLTEGCGPDCGTDAAAGGCASGNCASCAVATACVSNR